MMETLARRLMVFALAALVIAGGYLAMPQLHFVRVAADPGRWSAVRVGTGDTTFCDLRPEADAAVSCRKIARMTGAYDVEFVANGSHHFRCGYVDDMVKVHSLDIALGIAPASNSVPDAFTLRVAHNGRITRCDVANGGGQ